MDIVETRVSNLEPNLESVVDHVNTRMDKMVLSTSVVQQKFTAALLRLDDLENQNRRNNIQFRSIPVNIEEVELRPTIQSICNNILGTLDELVIDRVHCVTPSRSFQGGVHGMSFVVYIFSI